MFEFPGTAYKFSGAIHKRVQNIEKNMINQKKANQTESGNTTVECFEVQILTDFSLSALSIYDSAHSSASHVVLFFSMAGSELRASFHG